MHAFTVVKHFDPLKDLLPRVRNTGITFMVDVLRLQGVVEALHWRVVPAIPLATHALEEAALSEQKPILDARVLASPVRM